MRVSRVFSATALAEGEVVALDEHSAHYLANVLRLREGAQLVLFDGSGRDFDACINQVDRKRVSVRIGESRLVGNESPLQTTLAIGMGKGERMDWVVQKTTELGVNSIQPLWSARVEVKLTGERLARKRDHWRQVSIAACEQCGRSRLVQIAAPLVFEDWLTQIPATRAVDNNEKRSATSKVPCETSEARLLMHGTGERFAEFAATGVMPSRAILLVGPEGGFTPPELGLAEAAGFQRLQFGPRVLRTETAPVVGIALLQQQWGDY
ncbi:MAG: 16S rRNA (uracil(1498)-N(3))-methyltransferase [Pseudomonadales bacterium]